MKFWSEMENLSSVSKDDKIMIGKASDGTTCYAEVSKLPFASKFDLIGGNLDSIQISSILIDGINSSFKETGKIYAQYEDMGYWKVVLNDEVLSIYDKPFNVVMKETGEAHVLQPNGVDKAIEIVDQEKLFKLNVGSVSAEKITSIISVTGINKTIENDTQSTLVYNKETNNWTFRTRSAGNNQTIPLTDSNNDFIVYSQDDNKFYKCQPANPTPQEMVMGGGNGFKNIIFLGVTRLYSYSWNEFKYIAASTKTYSDLISSELAKVNIGDTIAIPLRVSDFNEKIGCIVASVESIDLSGSSFVGKGISYILSDGSQNSGNTSLSEIVTDSTLSGNGAVESPLSVNAIKNSDIDKLF